MTDETETPNPVSRDSGANGRDLTDNRKPYDWAPRYEDRRAKRRIRWEATYVFLLLLGCPVFIAAVWLGALEEIFRLTPEEDQTMSFFAYTWVSGTLGGTVFVTKWLYHSVAKGLWHMDRSLWRVYTPHLSGAFALAILALATSGLVNIIDRDALHTPAAAVGLGFILGYYSDYTAAALADFARHLLGDPRARRSDKDRADDS